MTAAPASTTAVKPIKLTVAVQSPPTAWNSTEALVPWLKQIENASKGRVQFEIYYSQTLVKSEDAWKAVTSGITDIARITHSVYPGLTPLYDVMTLPFLNWTSAKQSSGIAWKLHEKFPSMRNEFKTVRLLTPYTTTSTFIETSKKQIKTLADFKGMKLRAIAGPQTELMKLLGVAPMMMTQADVYTNIQKGVVDGSSSNWDATFSFRTYEVAKYHTDPIFGASLQSHVMNIEKFNSLPKDIQDALDSNSGLNGAEFWGYNMFDRLTDDVRPKIKKEGYEVIDYSPPAEEIQKWIDIGGKPVWDKWVKDNKAAGRTDAEEILNTALGLIKTYKP
jgi:TRAP-type transport system periplasmic protein